MLHQRSKLVFQILFLQFIYFQNKFAMQKHIFWIEQWFVASKDFQALLGFEVFVVLKNKFAT